MNFGEALIALKSRKKVARQGWNGKGMWIAIEPVHLSPQQKHGEYLEMTPYIAMKTADGKYVPWLASQTDVLAEDWLEHND